MGKSLKTYVLLSAKNWHDTLFYNLSNNPNENWVRIKEKDDFVIEKLKLLNPVKIFIPHWSYIIPSNIYERWDCIVFHMTDLPFGRGGSPLQNLIVRGFNSTKISAIKVRLGIDTGDVYLKKTLDLGGSAEQIFRKSSKVIEDMIKEIIINNITPSPQIGDIVEFKRRKPEESNISELEELEDIYNYIRMLDCEGYPHAFIETDFIKAEFTNAVFNESKKIITANVRIFKK
jgi:methionyl-tRNA formyltransferase